MRKLGYLVATAGTLGVLLAIGVVQRGPRPLMMTLLLPILAAAWLGGLRAGLAATAAAAVGALVVLPMLGAPVVVDVFSGLRIALLIGIGIAISVMTAHKDRAVERFGQIAESISQVFWLTDAETHRLVYISPGFEKIWGISAEELRRCPMSFAELVHEEDRERVLAAVGVLAEGGYDITYRIVRRDGEMRWIRDTAYPVRDARRTVVRLAGIASDITAQRALEDQLRQTQKLESIGLLAGGVAHDFNNILGVITTSIELLAASVPAEGRELVDEIQSGVSRASTLTQQLLAFSRKQIVAPVRLDLNETVKATRNMLRRMVGETISLDLSLDPSLPEVVLDHGQATQILVNLVVNARDAMDHVGLLRIETRASGGEVALLVTDSGCGMTPEVRARIFEPFFTTKGVGKGTGLGLSVVHGIVQQAGGTIDVASTPGEGTTFRIALPAAPPQPVRAKPATISPDARASGQHERILVVDDDRHVRKATARALRSRGYEVLEAGDARSALALLDVQGVELMVTDVVMPETDGCALAEAARTTHPALKVLFTSGYTDDEILRHGISQTEVPFLEKPYPVSVLAAKVRQMLDA